MYLIGQDAGLPAIDPDEMNGRTRTFLILQGPPSSFFRRLARKIEAQGGRTIKINFNASDWLYSLGMNAVNFRRSATVWPGWVREFARAHNVTDLIVYGDCREYHKIAISMLRPMGVMIHVLEEGYVRPAWITYERNGVNGHSRLGGHVAEPISTRKKCLAAPKPTLTQQHSRAPCGPTCFAASSTMPLRLLDPAVVSVSTEAHRTQGTVEEAWMWLKRLPLFAYRPGWSARVRGGQIARGNRPYFLVLLQLGRRLSDAQSQRLPIDFGVHRAVHSFILSIAAQARMSALVFKSHPLDSPMPRICARRLRFWHKRYGLDGRCELIDGGKLAYLTEQCTRRGLHQFYGVPGVDPAGYPDKGSGPRHLQSPLSGHR